MRECSLAAQRGACCVHSCHRIRRCGGAGNAELSTTEAFAARMIRLLCRGLFSCVAIVHLHDFDAWVQLCCSTGRVLCAQRPPSSVRMLVLLKLRCSVSGAVSMGGRPRKRSACASGVDGAFGASEVPNSRVAMRHQARVLANAIAQSSVGAGAADAAIVSGAVSMGGRPRKCSACASGVDGAFGSSEMPNSRVAMRHQARVLANAIAQSSVGAGAPKLRCSASNAVAYLQSPAQKW